MSFEQKIAFLSVLIQLIGVFFYIRGMIQGTTKPDIVSWFIWALGPLIGAWLAWQAGAGLSILPVFMAGFNPVLVVITSLIIKNGYWKITKLDIVCGSVAMVSLISWLITKNFLISVFFAILTDVIASIPTIVKAWSFPETEKYTAYLGGLIANILGLLIITKWTFPIYSLGVYLILVNILILFCIYRKKIISIFSEIYSQ